MIGTLAVVLVFGGLIFFHELGHFAAARAFGMGVKTFSLGFGPALLSFKRGKTICRVAALPLGGYVSLVGESEDAEIPDGFTAEESFSLRPAWQRFLVILAGPVFNLLLAWLICWGLMCTGGREFLPPVIGEIVADSPAAESPLRPGDTIISVDGVQVGRWLDIAPLVQRGGGKPVVVTSEQPDGVRVTFAVTPERISQTSAEGHTIESWAMGIKAGAVERREFGFFAAAVEGMAEAGRMAAIIWNALGDLVSRKVPFDNVGGPILIAQAIHTQTEHGIASVLMLAALISVNLGVLNLLPIPVLDGGHLVFLVVEMVGRRPVPMKVREKAMFAGLALLLFIMVAATFNDVMRFWS